MSNILPSDSQAQVDSRWCDWCGEVHHKQTYFVWDEYSRMEKYGYRCWFVKHYPGWSRWAFLLAVLSVTAWPIFGVTEFFMHLHVDKGGTWQSMVGVHWWPEVVRLRASGVTYRELAERFDTTPSTIWKTLQYHKREQARA